MFLLLVQLFFVDLYADKFELLPCGLTLNRIIEGSIKIPENFKPLLATPRLLIGRGDSQDQVVILTREGHETVGTLGVYIFSDKGMIGIPPFKIRGKGYPTEAMAALIFHHFQNPAIKHFDAHVMPHNAGSIALHLKLGFVETKRANGVIYYELNRENFLEALKKLAQDPDPFLPRGNYALKPRTVVKVQGDNLQKELRFLRDDLEKSLQKNPELKNFLLSLNNPTKSLSEISNYSQQLEAQRNDLLQEKILAMRDIKGAKLNALEGEYRKKLAQLEKDLADAVLLRFFTHTDFNTLNNSDKEIEDFIKILNTMSQSKDSMAREAMKMRLAPFFDWWKANRSQVLQKITINEVMSRR